MIGYKPQLPQLSEKISEQIVRRIVAAIPIYAALVGLPLEVDAEIAVFTPLEVEEWRQVPMALVTTALREGKVLYERQH